MISATALRKRIGLLVEDNEAKRVDAISKAMAKYIVKAFETQNAMSVHVDCIKGGNCKLPFNCTTAELKRVIDNMLTEFNNNDTDNMYVVSEVPGHGKCFCETESDHDGVNIYCGHLGRVKIEIQQRQ